MGIDEDEAGTAFIILDESIPEIATATGLCCDGRQEQQQFVFPFDVNAAVREMEPINFSLPSNVLDPCNAQPIQQAKTRPNQLLCLLSPLLRTKTTANTSGRRLTGDEQTQADKGGALVTRAAMVSRICN